jgi:hypothetical protein
MPLKIMEIARSEATVVVVARRAPSFIDPDHAFEAAGIERESASEPELYSAASQGR